ncbi:TetR/AcrR family transcriptional regulator [Saccharopolyspora flava]|uniref:TetR/AcrR family transcriptional regulator n=1 Tax=Saccharopolyspora flava TaxID=95161 RepID=UPI001FECB432|nr:TetR/AcrR family transcriptional regulator [Saccharopolyspora flava]
MVDGATPALKRRVNTAHRLTAAARRRTGEDGLSGFTVDEICDEAGISRRTFFNYFASKEDAVLGFTTLWDQQELEERFTAGGDPDEPGISASLLDDYAALLVERWTEVGLTPEHVADLVAATDREPRLFSRLFESIRARERADIDLVRTREGLPEDDVRANVAVQMVSALAGACMGRFLDPDNTDPLHTIMQRRLVAAREVFAATLTGGNR